MKPMANAKTLLTELEGKVPADSEPPERHDDGIDPPLAQFVERVVIPLLVARLLAATVQPPDGTAPSVAQTSEVVN